MRAVMLNRIYRIVKTKSRLLLACFFEVIFKTRFWHQMVLSISISVGCVAAYSQQDVFNPDEKTCLTDLLVQSNRSNELSSLVIDDQADREKWGIMSKDDLNNVVLRDRMRRMRVGEIFGEGCLKTAADYVAASLIYQHGDVPEHYYQAFIWAGRAVALGDEEQKKLEALTIDRYLVSIGKKQLFGSQFFASEASGWCYCLQPVESSFPDDLRKNYLGRTLSDEYDALSLLNHGKNNCIQRECQEELEPSPQGTVLGFW